MEADSKDCEIERLQGQLSLIPEISTTETSINKTLDVNPGTPGTSQGKQLMGVYYIAYKIISDSYYFNSRKT